MSANHKARFCRHFVFFYFCFVFNFLCNNEEEKDFLILKKMETGRLQSWAVVAHAFNPSTWEAEAGGFLSSRPAWSTKWVSGQPGLYRETLWKTKPKTNKQDCKMPRNLPSLADPDSSVLTWTYRYTQVVLREPSNTDFILYFLANLVCFFSL